MQIYMANRIFQRLFSRSGNQITIFLKRNSSNVPQSYKIAKEIQSGEGIRPVLEQEKEIEKLSNAHERDREKMKETHELEITSMFTGRVKQKIQKTDVIHFEHALQNKRNKEGFIEVVHNFRRKDKRSRGHLGFIYTGIKYIHEFGLQKNLDAYNELLDVFPKDKFVNRTLLDALWPKPHPQIDCALELLTLMEDNYVRPDNVTYTILMEVFGRASIPVQKAQRMAFWFDKYKDINPYLMDEEDLKDRFTVCKKAMERITKDSENIRVYRPEDLEQKESLLITLENKESMPVEDKMSKIQDYFLISSQNQEQRDFITNYDSSHSLYVEGPFSIWMNNVKEEYFILRTGCLSIPDAETHEDETKVREGMILGLCITNLPVRLALKNWIKYLQEDNTKIGDFNIIFNLDIPEHIVPVSQ